MTGRRNKLTAQIGESLACAELGKQGLIASPFAGNVPEFDVLVADECCRSIPIQVKSSNSLSWPSDARYWLDIDFDKKTGKQNKIGKKAISNPNLIYIFVSISSSKTQKDRFFILRKSDLQDAAILGYSSWMEPRGWIRPRNPESYDNRIGIDLIQCFEDNWDLIKKELNAEPGGPANLASLDG
jgi:hypothetical protein